VLNVTKILFISPARKSREMLVARVMTEARNAGIEIEINTATEKEGLVRLASDEEVDMILLCPGIRFLLNEPEEVKLLRKVPIIIVPSDVFGSLDAPSLLHTIRSILI